MSIKNTIKIGKTFALGTYVADYQLTGVFTVLYTFFSADCFLWKDSSDKGHSSAGAVNYLNSIPLVYDREASVEAMCQRTVA